MKKTNKILSIILALFMLTSVFIIPASAEATPYTYLTIEASETRINVGDIVQFDIVVDEYSDIGALTVDLIYDSDVFEPYSLIQNNMFEATGNGDEKSNLSYAAGKARFTGATAYSLTERGVLFSVNLKAKKATSDSRISLDVVEATNHNYDYMQVFTNTAFITVNPYTAPSLTIVANKYYAEIGDTVQVDVYVSENSDLSVLTADLIFDSSVFEPVMMTSNGMFNFDEDDDNEKINMNYADGKARFVGVTPYSITEEGILFSVLLKVVGNETDSAIYLDIAEACDEDWNYIEPETNTAYFTTFIADFSLSINEPSRTTIRCKDGIVLRYDVHGYIPCTGGVIWSWDNDNFDVEENDDGSITIISKNKGYTTFTASYIDMTGEVIAYDTIEMYSKASFFDKISGFFRSLFGTAKIYEY